MNVKQETIPSAFIWRRVHSIFGLFIVFFLIEHIITNSQSALLIGENGEGFVRAVNFIKNLPYLPALEIFLIGVPIAVHGAWGIKYALTGKANSFPSKGEKPSLTKYPRNHAYTLQRITSWILLVGIILHVGYMRFYRYPSHAMMGHQEYYFARLDVDNGLYSVAERLGVTLLSPEMVQKEIASLQQKEKKAAQIENKAEALYEQKNAETVPFSSENQEIFDEALKLKQEKKYMAALEKRQLKQGQVLAQSKDFGTATLLMVRDAFKSPFKGMLYTIFVLAASFHAFNGLWTFCITWGVVIRMRSQRALVNICTAIMVIIAFLGLASVWGTYWINLPR